MVREDIPASTAAKHAEIARRYAWQARQRRDGAPHLNGFAYLRMRDLEVLWRDRYGSRLPDDDAGYGDAVIAANHVAHIGNEQVILSWLQAWAPWMPRDRALAIAEKAVANPLKWSADKLAWRLGLRLTDRTRLKITTIGAIDANRDQRATIAKARKAKAEAARRLTRGATPRSLSAARTKPWEMLGISRATWYRRGKPGSRETNSWRAKESLTKGATKSSQPLPSPGAAGSANAFPEELTVPEGPGPLRRRGARLSEKKKKEDRPVHYATAGLDGTPVKSKRLRDLEAEVLRRKAANLKTKPATGPFEKQSNLFKGPPAPRSERMAR